MPHITRAQLEGYADDLLSAAETAEVEKALRASPELRAEFLQVLRGRDRGEHSLGAIWRRQRLSCPSREQLEAYLQGQLDPALADYLAFHLEVIGCAYCQANRDDLRQQQQEAAPQRQQRQERLLRASARHLPCPPEQGRAGKSRRS